MLHPIVTAAVLVLVVNDHVLKAALPGLLTGKASDFAGLLFFPLLLVAAWEVSIASIGRWHGPRLRPLAMATIATGLAFVAVKTSAAGSSQFAHLLGSLQWLGASAAHLVVGGPQPLQVPVSVAHDPTDLVALASLVVAFGIGLRRVGRTDQPVVVDRP